MITDSDKAAAIETCRELDDGALPQGPRRLCRPPPTLEQRVISVLRRFQELSDARKATIAGQVLVWTARVATQQPFVLVERVVDALDEFVTAQENLQQRTAAVSERHGRV